MMKKRLLLRITLCVLALGLGLPGRAQCKAVNTSFKGGEKLTYEMFFNWKFVWVKAGTATMQTTDTQWEGNPAYKSHLLTRTSKRLDKFFCMRDTLESIISPDMQPLYYRKAANEGGKYYRDQVWYTYPGGKTHLQQDYLNRRGELSHASYDTNDCIYDMMSMLLRARSFDASDYKVGQKLQFPMADGRKVEQATLIYRGRKNVKMESNGITYKCLVFSFVEYEKKAEKEIITFYITDDANHIPVRLDMFLRFGVAKAYLTEATGLRNPSSAIVKKQ